jgi:two-component system OmpR family sensor kinase
MSRLPIRWRLTLTFASVMAVVLVLVGVFLYIRLGDALDERIADSLESRLAALAQTLDPSDPVASGEEGVAQVLATDGSVVDGSATAPLDSILTAAELERARSAVIRFDRSGQRFRAAQVGDRVVVVGEPLDDRDEALDALLTQLLIALPLALLVASGIGYLVAAAALRPVEVMRARAAGITPDTPERRLPLPPARDEVYRLGETLNEMLERLDAGLERERRFVADASHELRTPLAILKAELELALRQPRTPRELESALRSAAEETDRLVRLAEDLLLVARSDRGALQLRWASVGVDDVLAAAAARFGAKAASRQRDIEVEDELGLEVDGDRLQLDRALDNLVENALRHGDGTVRLAAVQAGGQLELHVTDEGGGFPTEFLPVALERFARADDARGDGGTGLGLAIAEAIAKAHGGAVHATNRAGGGADVWIALPARLNAGDASLADRCHVG